MQKVPPFPRTPFPLQKLLSGRMTGSCPSARRPLPAGLPERACGGRCFSSFLIRSRAASARHGERGRLRGGRQGIRGLGGPLPPTTPNPALGQSSLTGSVSRQAHPVPLSAARHMASPSRCPAPRGTSVRAASELPRLGRGDLLRAMTRLLHQTG